MNDRTNDKELRADQFLKQAGRHGRGRLKIYIGMSAGVGKTYRMLQEAHALQQKGVNIKVGLVETHSRKETEALVAGLSVIPRREVFYKGKRLEEMDLQAILLLHPEVVLVDELAHSNIPGSRHEKRWQDVEELLAAGISVITAVNIQHIESINEEVRQITGVEVKERIPDRILQVADEVVNIDLTADELIARLKEGKIYDTAKVQQALKNFFQPEKILQLRELALKEVAGQVERKVDYEITARPGSYRHERFLACISSNPDTARRIIRKTARLASYYNSQWWVLYVQTPRESTERIPLDRQRHLINNFKLATELGAELIQLRDTSILNPIFRLVEQKQITTLCMGKPHLNLWQVIWQTGHLNQLLKVLAKNDVDLIILS
ncbi:MAG: sensor protein KdpD [Chitinophagaceae bacterium]